MPATPWFPLHLQISAEGRARLGLPAEVIAPAPGTNLFALRLLAQQLRTAHPAIVTGGAGLNLLAQLTRVFRYVATQHLAARACVVGRDQLRLYGEVQPFAGMNAAQAAFVSAYPPAQRPLPDSAEGEASWRNEVAIELFVLAGQSRNPAALEFRPIFDPIELDAALAWQPIVEEFDQRLVARPLPGRLGRSLLTLLLEPVQASPHSLAGQLRYIREAWHDLLSPELLDELLIAFDLLAEEEQQRGGAPGPTPVPTFGSHDYDDAERFSRDSDWMPNVVLIAKTVYVWLDQLSRRYGRTIDRLDQIPDEELDRLSRWGFTSLWLIGIWERSPASAMIKQRMGNSEAVASAYSLFDYVVASDLGGEGALHTLQERCGQRGLRLACDVVPNHTGIDSRWTREHPDWYVQVEHPPYPAYQFSGPNLSCDPATECYVEDGYWNHSDAAVVFKHVQHGRVRYLYHGNDGTHLPWNDTAQLNFLLPEVREAMIGLIVAVARRFPIIRFDAAMTLAKKHFQRLWFPQPGGGAGVSSRAEHALSRAEFERLFPVEFWREVVDRVAIEAPDTLLLAEAFWLMEGFFVRTLGMHRVYNSAFMNMLKEQENAKYRAVIKNILEFDPEILKRFVSFMNNPDEETAVAQFGKTDKYFGVAMMLATLPGLPMFGHGQIEGLEEKYGMEYRRAYRDEVPDEGFIRHHEDQIFPLLRRRPLFSGAEHFILYDFFSGEQVNEEVFAYSNRQHDERALVVYHNCHAQASGWVRTSTGKRRRDGGGEQLLYPTLSEGLGLGAGGDRLWRCRDYRSGEEYLWRAVDLAEQGLQLLLGEYAYHVFLDWRELVDDGVWGELCRRLQGRPVADLDREWRELRHVELYALARQLFTPLALRSLTAPAKTAAKGVAPTVEKAELSRRFDAFIVQLGAGAPLLATELIAGAAVTPSLVAAWLLLRSCGPAAVVATRLEATGLISVIGELLESDARLLPLLLLHAEPFALTDRKEALAALLADPHVGLFLAQHEWDGQRYVRQEPFELLIAQLQQAGQVAIVAAGRSKARVRKLALTADCERLLVLAAAGSYQVDKICDSL